MENTVQEPLVQNTEETAPQPRKNKIVFFIILLIILLGIIFLVYFFQYKNLYKNDEIITKDTSNKTPTSKEETAFQEMTVPYLREREYKSKLGELEPAYENVNYTAFLTSYDSDGLKVNGLLLRPTGQEPEGGWPAVVFVHGYIPPSDYRTLEKYNDYVDYLARNGLVVFKIDLRGHGDSEGEPGGGYFSSDYVVDTLNAYAALQNADFVNPDGIGLWGHSMAGNIVMRSMVSRPNIQAGVIWAGAVYTYLDMQEFGIQDSSYRPPENNTQRQNKRRELFEKHGSPSATSPFWQKVAPVNYLQDSKGSVQIHHAIDDDVVNIGYSRNLNELLDAASVGHELFEYQSGGHNITGVSFTSAMERTVQFFKENLQ